MMTVPISGNLPVVWKPQLNPVPPHHHLTVRGLGTRELAISNHGLHKHTETQLLPQLATRLPWPISDHCYMFYNISTMSSGGVMTFQRSTPTGAKSVPTFVFHTGIADSQQMLKKRSLYISFLKAIIPDSPYN